jgi:predicted aldo/keto reductase-like oxidoreductase
METKMIYRPIGKTGMSAGIVGLGTEYLDNKPWETVDSVINTALDHGINIMDLFMPGETVRKNIGRALAGRRKDIIIQGHIGSTDINEQYGQSRDLPTIKKYFENLLNCLNTDYIDIGMLFFIDSEKNFSDVFDGDTLPYAVELKKQGRIRAIGASSHNPIIARKVVETGIVDLLMFSINPIFDMIKANNNVLDYLDKNKISPEKQFDPDRAALYRICEQRGVAITVMKTLAAGKLLSREMNPFGRAMTVHQCMHYALSRPAVVSTLIGCANAEQVTEMTEYLSANDEKRDYSTVIGEFQGKVKSSCMYCNHCLPCPSEINIAEVTKYTDIAALDEKNIPPAVTANYKALKHHGRECIACGNCEERCPFSVPVIENMKKAAALFGI